MKKIYLTIENSKGKITKGYILDISLGGISIAVNKSPQQNSIIGIKAKKNFALPLKGRVVSVIDRPRKTYKYRLGVKFINIGCRNKERLARFTRKLEKRESSRFIFD